MLPGVALPPLVESAPCWFALLVTQVLLRRAQRPDAFEIARVHRLSRASYYGAPPETDDDRETMWANLIGEQERLTYVAEESSALIGFMSAYHRDQPVAAFELAAIYVLPDHHGRGVGSRLYEVFEDERLSTEAGLLEVWAGNTRAIEFYLRRGWTPTSNTRPGPQGLEFVTYRLDPELHESHESVR